MQERPFFFLHFSPSGLCRIFIYLSNQNLFLVLLFNGCFLDATVSFDTASSSGADIVLLLKGSINYCTGLNIYTVEYTGVLHSVLLF